MTKTIKNIFYISLTLNVIFIFLFNRENIKIHIKNILKDTLYSKSIQAEHLKPIDIYDNNITISGLPFSSKENNLNRLPIHMKNTIRKPLWEQGTYPSGGRIRFKTDSKTVSIVAKSSSLVSHHMTSIMKNGLDIYVNDQYAGSAWPDANGKIESQFTLDSEGIPRNITLYLPLYSHIEITKLYVEQNSTVNQADNLLKIPPIIYYGSSITQGASASNPGLSYPAIISRNTKIDFINLGFSGNGFGDLKIANMISSLESSLLVLDYWANPSVEQFKENLPKFIASIRKKQKNLPILIITPFYSIDLGKQNKQKQKIIHHFVSKIKLSGEQNIYIMEGTKMLSKELSFGLIDGIHLNSLGFWFAAKALEPKIIEILKKY